jgi:hypothetical protein
VDFNFWVLNRESGDVDDDELANNFRDHFTWRTLRVNFTCDGNGGWTIDTMAFIER